MKLPNGTRRLWMLPQATKLLDDFYVLDLETAHRPGGAKMNQIFTDSSKYKGALKWKLEATPRAFVFGIIYGRNYTFIAHSVDDMKKELKHPRFRRRYVYAHNGGRFDWLCLYGNIFDTDPEALFIGSKLISFSNGVATLCDSTNIFVGMKIEVIGAMIGKKKTGMSDNYGTSHWPKDYARDVQGCLDDCLILWDALLSTFEFAGNIKLTQASLSMAYFRRHHQPYNIDFNENVKHFYESYYGGRTECFKMGSGHYSVIDVNSMYPYHLRNSTFPNPRSLRCEVDINTLQFSRTLLQFEGMADLTIQHHETEYGYLPYRSSEGKLLFPVGTFRGKWNFPEVRNALENGAIKILTCHKAVYGEPMASPFASYVDSLHDIKQKATKAGDEWLVSMTKYYLNMLYGKFGQNNEERTIYLNDITKQWHVVETYQRNGKFKRLIRFNKNRNDFFMVIGAKGTKPAYCIPSFASYVTSMGRVQIVNKLYEMHPKGVAYCDTDSLFFSNAVGVTSSEALGDWKIENKIITNIYGLKNYTFIDDKKAPVELFRSKGIPSMNPWKLDKVTKEWKFEPRTVKLFDGDEETTVAAIERTAQNSFKFYQLIQTKEALKRNIEPGHLALREKTLTGKYDKRIVNADGTTKPIIIK